jgi:hypothetical protein
MSVKSDNPARPGSRVCVRLFDSRQFFVLLLGEHTIYLQQDYPPRLVQFTWCSGARIRPASAARTARRGRCRRNPG